MLITTTPGIEGRTVTEYLGVVTAQGVLGSTRSRTSAPACATSSAAGPSPMRTSWHGVSDALAELETQAGHLGADAVVGVDIDYETVGDKMLMVSARARQ